MSFKDFQKASNKLTLREIGLLILAGTILVLALYGLAIGNAYLANILPDGGEFYLLRTGGRSFLFDRIEPYGGSIPARVQEQVYDRPAVAGEDFYILDIPFHLLILFFPLALFRDAIMARAFWMALSEIALVSFVFLSFRLLSRRIPTVFIGLISIAGFTSFYAFRSLIEGSPILLLSLAYVGILVALGAGLDELAGALLVLSVFHWEIGGPFLVFVALWVFWEKRWRVFSGAGMLALVLLVISFLWYPGWVLPFLRAAWNSLRTGFGFSIHVTLIQLWPRFGNILGWVLTAALVVVLGYEWRAARGADFPRFIWTACLTLVATPLLGHRLEFDQLFPFTFPIMLVIAISRERWQNIGNGIAFLLLLFFFGLPWLLVTQGVPQGIDLREAEILFFFWPVFTVIGLYWIRWWMLRPPRTWFDRAIEQNR